MSLLTSEELDKITYKCPFQLDAIYDSIRLSILPPTLLCCGSPPLVSSPVEALQLASPTL